MFLRRILIEIYKANPLRPAALLAGLLALGSAGCGPKDPVLARVGREKVTAADLLREMGQSNPVQNGYLETPAGRRELLELLVRRKILLSEAKRADFPSRAKLEARLKELKAELERQHRETGERLLIGEYFRFLQGGDLKVTDAEVRDYWAREKETRAGHILFSDEAAARAAKERLAAGEPFEKLARELSEDKATGAAGGDMGYLLPGSLVPSFEKALAGLKPGEVSGVVSSPFGHHLIRKTGERKLADLPFEENADRIRSVVEKKKFQDWLEQARRRYDVFTNPAALDNLKTGEPAADARLSKKPS